MVHRKKVGPKKERFWLWGKETSPGNRVKGCRLVCG